MLYGRFVDKILVELFYVPSGHSIDEYFNPAVGFIPVPSDAQVGWIMDDNGNIIPPPPPPAPTGPTGATGPTA